MTRSGFINHWGMRLSVYVVGTGDRTTGGPTTFPSEALADIGTMGGRFGGTDASHHSRNRVTSITDNDDFLR